MLLELIFPIQPKNTDLIPSSFETHRAELLILQVVYNSTTNIQKEKNKMYSPHAGYFKNEWS